jgi:leader peptidase (prepilin peptidase)/N-methyltransferase
MPAMPSALTAAAVSGAVALAASPYLARLTLSVPDRESRSWWRGHRAGRRRTVALAGVALVCGALAGAAAGWTSLLPALVWLALTSAPLAVIDLEHHRLPNRLVFLADAGAAVLLAVAAGVRGEWQPLLRAAEGAAAVFAALFVLVMISPRAFGYGDVKLGALLGGYLGWFGWLDVYYGIFGGFVLGAVAGLVLIALRRAGLKTALPFGPSMILGALVVLAFDLTPSLTRR